MILQQIKEKISLYDKSFIAKNLGYKNINTFEKTLAKLLQCKSVKEWLESGYYDLVNNSKYFYINLCILVEIPKVAFMPEVLEYERNKQEAKRFEDSYIFINTNFIRQNQPIFVLAIFEKYRYLTLANNEHLYSKTDTQILDILSSQIKAHYKQNENGLQIWGQIVSYQVHLFGKTYIFDTNGVLQQDMEVAIEHKAFIGV